MTTLRTATASPPSVPPLQGLDADARVDRTVRLASALLLWLGLLLVTYWWDGGRRRDRSRRAGRDGLTSVGRLTGLWSARPAAGAGAADVAAAAAGARLRPGPAGPDPPGDRLLVLRPDGRPHRHDHRRLRLRPLVGRAADDLGSDHHLRRRPAGRSPARPAWSWWWSPASRRPGGGCATSRGTCSTCTPISASGSHSPTSCGRGRSSSARRAPPSTGGRCGPPPPQPCWCGGSGCPSGAACGTGCGSRSVVRESSDVVSVYLTGRRLDRLPVRAGQFLNVRFLDGTGLDPGQPVLAVRRARRAQPADHRQGARRRQRPAGAPAAGHPGAVRGPVRPPQQPGPYAATGRARRRRRRHHPAAGAGRRAATTRRVRRSCCSATPASRCSPRELQILAAERGLQVLALPGPRRTPRLGPGPGGGRRRRAGRAAVLDSRPRRPRRLPLRARPPGRPASNASSSPPASPDDRIHTESFGW